jgi:hypothetical protein
MYVSLKGQLVDAFRAEEPDILQQKYVIAVVRLHRSEKGKIALKPTLAAKDLTLWISCSLVSTFMLNS